MLFEKGEMIKLRLSFAGHPIPQVAWYKDTQLIDDIRVNTEVIDQNTALMCIFEARRSDTGLYSCMASNEYGEARANVDVQVMDVPMAPDKPVIIEQDNKSLKIR